MVYRERRGGKVGGDEEGALRSIINWERKVGFKGKRKKGDE